MAEALAAVELVVAHLSKETAGGGADPAPRRCMTAAVGAATPQPGSSRTSGRDEWVQGLGRAMRSSQPADKHLLASRQLDIGGIWQPGWSEVAAVHPALLAWDTPWERARDLAGRVT